MIHNTLKQWQHTGYDHSIRKENLILDLSLFSQINPYFQELSEKTKIPAQTLSQRFEEIIVDIAGLKEYLHVVIVRLDSFNQKFEKPQLRGLNKLEGRCIFDMLVNTYAGIINLGIDIPIEKGHEFPGQYVTEEQMKKAKIFSVRVNIEDIQKLDFLKKFKINIPVQCIHINLTIRNPQDLIEFQRFLIDNQFPVESIILTTNLLSILKPAIFSKDQTVTLDYPDRYAYHHNRTLQRLLNGAFLNVFQYYNIPYQSAIKYGDTQLDGQLDVYFKLFLQVHKQKNKIGDFKGGFVISPSMFLPSLKHFHGGFEADLTITSYAQRYGLISLRLAMNGQFKTLKPANISSKQ